jgi:hypothetical protein
MFHAHPKLAALALPLLVALRLTFAGDASFHDEINAIRNRYHALNNREVMGESLSASEEEERQCILGKLTDQDPVTALTRELIAEHSVLKDSKKPEERAVADKLLSLMQITTSFEGRATTLSEAKSFASILGQFVARRDVEGAKAWANAQ